MLRLVLGILVVIVASPASAHVSGVDSDLASGFVHPFSGIDHLLSMIAIGLWAVQTGGRATWLLPVVFPVAMTLGAVAGISAVDLPLVELGIALSVLSLGALIAFAIRVPVVVGAVVVAVFAVMHGHAHGIELPAGGGPVAYGAGFVAATVVLHGVGISLGFALRSTAAARLVRTVGATIALVGAGLVLTL